MRRRALELLRDGWPIVAGVVAGVAIGSALLAGESTRYRAETRVAFHQRAAPSSGVPRAVKALAASGLLEQSVRDVLSVSRPQLTVRGGGDSVLRLIAQAEDRELARLIDTEASSFLVRLVGERLGGTDANVVEDVHVTKLGPLPARDLLAGAMIGLSVGLLAAAGNLLQRRPRKPVPVANAKLGVERSPAPAMPAYRDDTLRNVDVLEVLVAARSDEFPDLVEDWRTYLLFLRGHADAEGRLPPRLDLLVDEVFAPLLGDENS